MQSRGVLGFGGVFVASIFAQTLSMTSTGFNAMVDSLWSGIVEVSKTLDTRDVLHDFYNLCYTSDYCELWGLQGVYVLPNKDPDRRVRRALEEIT